MSEGLLSLLEESSEPSYSLDSFILDVYLEVSWPYPLLLYGYYTGGLGLGLQQLN